ncbi:MAG: glycerol-3-phosphate acyltransferase [Firmicutes bacterium]|nr:glycerol-3-phosphate acyltransferase [Bacillota bacterium]
MNPGVLALASYLIGSFPSGYLIGRAVRGLDIRRVGTGNVGTTNVVRNVGWPAGILTALLDAGKGMGVVLLAREGWGPTAPLLALPCAVIGHNWPVWLRFHGGGGLATFVGGLALMVPFWQIVVAGCLYGLVYLVTRHKYFSSVFMCAAIPVWLGAAKSSWDYFLFGLATGVLLGFKQVRAWIRYGTRTG